MIKNYVYFLLALPFFLLTACGEDDSEGESQIVDTTVVVKDDGTTSNGSNFISIDDKNFYLDYIRYTVEQGHLTVSGYDKLGFKGVANIVSKVTYKGNTYEVLSILHGFRECEILTSVNIPNSVITIDSYAFRGCKGLTSITIPSSVTTIGREAFKDCTGLVSFTIPNSVTTIGNDAFWGCTGLTSITIGNSVTAIGNRAFKGCTGLTSITIPNSVTTIGGGAFSGCTGLTSVTIGNSVTSIGDLAFAECSGLTSIHCKNEVPSNVRYDTFWEVTFRKATLYVPKGSIDAYRSAEWWRYFRNIVEE